MFKNMRILKNADFKQMRIWLRWTSLSIWRRQQKKIVTVANLSNQKVEFVPLGHAESPLREVARKKKMAKHET